MDQTVDQVEDKARRGVITRVCSLISTRQWGSGEQVQTTTARSWNYSIPLYPEKPSSSWPILRLVPWFSVAARST